VLAYLWALVLSFTGKMLVLKLSLEPVLFKRIVIHLAAGYCLNRYLLQRMEWNPNFTTLAVVAKAKLLALVFWPVIYAVLIFQLLVARYL